jgi:ribosomal-protein-alanine acetyltransferase
VPVRPASPTDIPALHALAQNSPTAAHWSQKQFAEVFTGPPRTVLVFEEAATIHGFLVARIANPDWELENIVVAQSHQRRGLATQLLRTLMAHAKSSGAANVILEVRASNETARAFYEHHSFCEVGRRPNYYTTPTEDAVLYRRNCSHN